MGPHQATMDLVDKLRGYRGRLTRMQLCAAVGLDPANKYHFKRVHQLCRDFDITTADPGRVDPLAHKTPKRLMAAENVGGKASAGKRDCTRQARASVGTALPWRRHGLVMA